MARLGATRIWCNYGAAWELDGLVETFRALRVRIPDLRVNFTAGRSVPRPDSLPDGMDFRPKPYDIPQIVDRFLADREPHLAVLTSSDLFPSAVSVCTRREVPQVLANAEARERGALQERLAAMRMGARLRAFRRIFAIDDDSAEALVRRGASRAQIEVLGKLEAAQAVPGCDEGEREYLSKQLSTRPVLLAAGLPLDELAPVEAAYRLANSQAHRLLLVVIPAVSGQGQDVVQFFEGAGWITARREAGEEPDLNVQVFVADAPDEAGLWYRLSPLTFLGGTLVGAPFPDPFEPAALGSAVLHGTALAVPSPRLQTLSAEGGCRAVANAADFGAAVSDLLAPDRAATIATRAWDVTTRGAESAIRAAEAMAEIIKGART